MGARGKREAFSKRLWKTPLHVCTCSQPFPKRLSRPEFPAFSTIAAASIGHALQHKSDPPKRQENPFFFDIRSSAFSIQGCIPLVKLFGLGWEPANVIEYQKLI